MENFKRFLRDEAAQDLVEYVMLISFIALFCILAMRTLGVAINRTYNSVEASFVAAGS